MLKTLVQRARGGAVLERPPTKLKVQGLNLASSSKSCGDDQQVKPVQPVFGNLRFLVISCCTRFGGHNTDVT